MSLYTTAHPRAWYGKMGLRFLEAIDLSENLVRVTKALKSIPNGVIALILGVIAILPFLGFGSLAWFFDIDSSWVAMDGVRNSIQTRLLAITAVGWLALLVGFMVQAVPWALTLLPTATEMLGSKFAQFNIPVFQWATWFFVLFDGASDIPRVNELMTPYWPQFVGEAMANAGWGEWFWAIVTLNFKAVGAAIGYHALWVLALFGASYFLELAALLCLWAVVGLLWKSLGYWLMKLFAGKGWASKFNRSGGFDDSSVKGGSVPRGGRAAPVVEDDEVGDDDDDGISEEELFEALGGRGHRRARA